MQPVKTPGHKVAVEYDCRGNRISKEFEDGYAAKRFYVLKFKQHKNPKLKKVLDR